MSLHFVVAVLSLRIRQLEQHLQTNKKDKHNLRRLNILVHRRKRLMNYFKRQNPEKYFQVLKAVGVRDQPQPFREYPPSAKKLASRA